MTSPKSSSDHPGVGLSWHRCLGGAHNISTYSPESHHKCYHIIFPQIFPRTLLILITSQFSFPAFRGKNDMICKTWILFMIYCKGFWGDTWWGLERKQKRFQFCVHSKSTDFNFNSTCLQLNEINLTKNMKDICPAVWFPRLKAEPLKASNPWKHSMLCTGYTMVYTGYMLHKYRAIIVNHCQWNNALHNVHIFGVDFLNIDVSAQRIFIAAWKAWRIKFLVSYFSKVDELFKRRAFFVNIW